jgi:thymidylate synthase
MENRFRDANEVFKYYKWQIQEYGVDFDDTRALFNIGFEMKNPISNLIEDQDRNWKWDYAEAEWQWYLSGDRNIKKLGELYGKVPEIWKRMADANGNVNSNYGWQWNRENQLGKVVDILKKNKSTRQAAISIYDGKEIYDYRHDTPCTYAVQFSIIDDKLCMSVYMRSNDLWYGFCNDQYQFASLQEMVADRLSIPTGWYYHHAHNLHLYNDKLK